MWCWKKSGACHTTNTLRAVLVTCTAAAASCRLKESNVNVWYYRAVTSLLEAAIGGLLVFTVFLPIPGTPNLTPTELPSYMSNATKCFLGQEVSWLTCFCSAVLADLQPCLQIDPLGRCSSSTIFVWPVFMVLDIITDIVALVITKYFSAATSVAVSTLILPLQTILFQVLPRCLFKLWVCCSHGRLMLCCDAGAVHRWRVTTAWPVCVQYCRSVRRCAGCGRVSSCRGAFQQAR